MINNKKHERTTKACCHNGSIQTLIIAEIFSHPDIEMDDTDPSGFDKIDSEEVSATIEKLIKPLQPAMMH